MEIPLTANLDEALLQELRGLMEDDFGLLLETFLQESERQHQAVKEAFDSGSMEDLRRSAHGLKGSCGNVGALNLAEVCADLEEAANAGAAARLPAAMAQLEEGLHGVQERIGAMARAL